MAKMSPEERAKLEAQRAAAQQGYKDKELAIGKELSKVDKTRMVSAAKLKSLNEDILGTSRSIVNAAQANAKVVEMQVASGENLVKQATELALLNNKGYQTQTKLNSLNDLAHANQKAMLAHMDEIDLMEDDSFKRLEKAKILNDAGAKTLKDELDLTKQLDLLNDKELTRDKLAQSISADKLLTAKAIAQLAIDEAVKNDAGLNAEKETLRVLQKQVDRSNELKESLDKFKEWKNDIFEVIQDPAVATGLFLVAWGNQLKLLNESLIEMEGNMGMSRSQAIELGPTLASANIQAFAMGVSAKLTQGAMEGMSEAMGTVGNLTGKQIAQTAKLSKALGVGAKETGKMVGHMMLVGDHTVDSAAASLKMTANLARGAGVPIGKVMSDVAENMELTSKFGNISVEELGNMAVEAAKMGTTLSNIASLGDKMMDVDNARNDAMELSVLLGKQVNIDKVQQLMYEGKGAEANKEMLKQLGGISAFNDMDYFQKKRSADMMGVTTMELEKQLNKAAGLTETGEKQASGWAKVTESATDYFGVLKDNSGTVLASMNMFKSLGSSIGAFGAGAKGTKGVFASMKAGLGGMKDKFLGKTPGAEKPGDLGAKINDTASSSDEIAKGPKKGMKDKLSDLSDGLKKMGRKGVRKGIGNMALAGPALVLALPSIPFLLFMGKVGLKSLESNFEGLGKGLKHMSKALGGTAVMALAGPALLIATLAIPFLTFMGLMPMAMLAANFKFLGQGLSSLGKGMANIMKGLLVLGLLGIAMIPAALAFSLLDGINPLSMLAFSISVGILGLAAAGLGMIFPMVLLGSAALAILGLAIIPAAFAMSQLAGVDPAAIIGFAVGLGILGLAVAGMGFLIIGIGLGAIAAHLLGAAIVPAVEALSGLKGADPGAVSSFAVGLLGLATTIAAIGLMTPLLILGGIGIALMAFPLLAFNKAISTMPENFDMTGFAEGIKTLGTAGANLIPAAIGIGFLAASLSVLAIALVVVTPMMLLFTAALSIIGDKIPMIVESIVTVLQSIKEVIVVISSEIVKVIETIQAAVVGVITQLSTQIIAVVTTIGNVISTTVKSIADDVIRIITTITGAIEVIGNVINSIVTNIANQIINVREAMSATISNIANEIIKVITAIATGMQTVGSTIVNVITSIGSSISSVIGTIATGISSVASSIGGAISGIIDSMAGFVSMLSSLSPSHIFSLAAGFTTLGLASVAMGIGAIGITGMSAALGLLALSLGLLAPLMPVIDKLAQFGLLGDIDVESNVNTTSTKEDDKEEKEVFDNSILATKLDTLIELMTKGGTVTLDGKKVGQILNNAMGPIGA